MTSRSSRRVPDVVGSSGSGPNQTSILFVCTANQCRSPFAEAIARRRVDSRRFVIGSAGLIQGGRPVPANGLLVAAEFDLDLSAHLSRRVVPLEVAGWDVILTMTREHVRELVAANPELWPRVFTIKQFRRWLDQNPPARRAKLGAWIDLAAAERPRSEMVGRNPDDEIADPLNSPPEAWRTLGRVLDGEIGAILGRLAGAGRPARL